MLQRFAHRGRIKLDAGLLARELPQRRRNFQLTAMFYLSSIRCCIRLIRSKGSALPSIPAARRALAAR